MHGTLADYRLGRLIKYSFYKNISFASMFFFFQFFNGWSGQASAHRLAAKAWLCQQKMLAYPCLQQSGCTRVLSCWPSSTPVRAHA